MKNIIYTALIAIMCIPIIYAQDINNVDLLKQLQGEGESSGSGAVSGEDQGYKSFVQNEFSNISKQMNDLTQEEMAKITLAELTEQRVRLATDLCVKDSRACFLIDAYRDYQDSMPTPVNENDLKLFGEEIFAGYTNEFNFYDSLPLTDEHILKMGDILNIYLYGGLDVNTTFTIDNQGSILIEDIGEIAIAGLSIGDARAKIDSLLNESYFGTKSVISLESVKSKEVFILGNIRTPGTFALNAFSSPLNALISSGGIKKNSSLRHVKLLRNGSEYAEIDFYNLLVKGDSSELNEPLKDGDTILVEGIKNRVSILGEVLRPAIYEFKEGESLATIIDFALGVTPFADLRGISVKRILPSGQKTILNPVDRDKFSVKNGDVITVNPSYGQVVDYVSLKGDLRNPKQFSHRANLKLGNLFRLESDLLASTYTGFAVIKRLNFASRSYSFVGFSLTNQALIDNIDLNSGDEVYFFSQNDIKFLQSKSVLSYLKSGLDNTSSSVAISGSDLSAIAQLNAINTESLQDRAKVSQVESNQCLHGLDVLIGGNIKKALYEKASIFSSNKPINCPSIFREHPDLLPMVLVTSIPVTGNVRFPGLYPVGKDLNALDLFYIAGGFLFPNYDETPLFEVGQRPNIFRNVLSGDLQTLNNLTYFKPQLNNSATSESYVKLVGEFENPGTYQISKGTKLSEIYKRAGGLTDSAFPLGGILTRNSIKKSEIKALARAKSELSQILASAVASGYLQQNSTDLIGLVSLMSDVTDAKPAGRLVAELNPSLISRSPVQDLLLEGGDVIYMPPMQNTVTIVGQVLNPVTVPYSESLRAYDYVDFAGGFQRNADSKRMYILMPNGKSAPVSMSILQRGPFSKNDILPGSTIIIPRKARPMDGLALVQTVSPILANLSVTAASIAAISDN
jgi:protein involved in polysaccharide export with SLBB domain